MVGHSKWSKVKRIKGPLAVKCGAAFRKLVKEFTVAAWIANDRPSGNPWVRRVARIVLAAKMTGNHIEHAF